jgi:hypothetical protein
VSASVAAARLCASSLASRREATTKIVLPIRKTIASKWMIPKRLNSGGIATLSAVGAANAPSSSVMACARTKPMSGQRARSGSGSRCISVQASAAR